MHIDDKENHLNIISRDLHLLLEEKVFITNIRFISDSPLTVRGSNEQLKKIYKDVNIQKEFEKYEMMDPVDINELSRVHQGIARQLDKVNEIRVKEMFIRIYRGMKVCTFWVFVVFAIYFYGCYALGQETFLGRN
uniref:SLC12 domain-containing protein n=1 Tax=Meloidogyne hapla TaxID=6305 RepID=A0A1I8BGT9_MELHA